MIPEAQRKQITAIWDNYVSANKTVLDTKGNIINDIDESRIIAIKEINTLINSFLKNDINVFEFKTSLDSYNKRHNLWGFTATKGQMFFNQLAKTNEDNVESLTALIKNSISEPRDLKEALKRIDELEKFVTIIFSKAKDKRKAPNPGSVGYFISYFWQIHNNQKWPILYTSLITSFEKLGIWTNHVSQKEVYEFFYNLNEEIKSILKDHTKKQISNWDAEHAFWNFAGKPIAVNKKAKPVSVIETDAVEEINVRANIDINDYLIRKVSNLIEVGNNIEKSASAKGSEYEKLVAEVFKQLDFEIELLGQGSGRNPDVIIKFREEHTAFIVDAKAYSTGYSLGIDDRAIREYINYYCPRLEKDGFKKIGFIIVSNSFKSDLEEFINDITWNTPIKRFMLLTSEALLYLLAYKTKDKLNLASIIESLVKFDNVITSQKIIEEFDDV